MKTEKESQSGGSQLCQGYKVKGYSFLPPKKDIGRVINLLG